MHDEAAGKADSRIDLNRTGTRYWRSSLTGHAFASGSKAFLTELKLLLMYLGVSDCNMQEGSLRVDANVNLHVSPGRKDRHSGGGSEEHEQLPRRGACLAYEAQRQHEEWRETARSSAMSQADASWDDQAQSPAVNGTRRSPVTTGTSRP